MTLAERIRAAAAFAKAHPQALRLSVADTDTAVLTLSGRTLMMIHRAESRLTVSFHAGDHDGPEEAVPAHGLEWVLLREMYQQARERHESSRETAARTACEQVDALLEPWLPKDGQDARDKARK